MAVFGSTRFSVGLEMFGTFPKVWIPELYYYLKVSDFIRKKKKKKINFWFSGVERRPYQF